MKQHALVAKIWSFCDTLRDDGVSYGDYLEQITYLLFLKMADEFSSPKFKKDLNVPENCNWQSILKTETNQLISTYSNNLKRLAVAGGMLTKIFDGAQNKIHDQYKLKKLIDLINEDEWITEAVDIKGEIYESLLQKNAESSGAGQYFTPRPVIQAIVECIDPKPLETIADPSCGTGGFFLGALNHLNLNKLTSKEKDFLRFKTFHGWEIVPSTARLCLMNLFLHGIGDLKTTPEIEVVDSLKGGLLEKVNIVLANPPFGKTSSDVTTNDEKKLKQIGYHFRKDFWTTTSNKQLAFLQHIVTMLNKNGRAAVVLPDNVLFEGGAGEIIRKKMLENTNLHTILRLPTGIFYAHGVKANVLFFELKDIDRNQPATKEIWYYDYRTNIHHTPKNNQLQYENLVDFIQCYCATDREKTKQTWNPKNEDGRWRKFTYDEVIARDKTSLDIFWLRDDNVIDLENLPEPDNLIEEIIENIESALANFKIVRESINN